MNADVMRHRADKLLLVIVANKGSYHCSRWMRLRRLSQQFERSQHGNQTLPLPGKPEVGCVRPTLQLSDSASRFLIQRFLNGEMLVRCDSTTGHRERLVRQRRCILLLFATHNISCCRGRYDCLGQASERYDLCASYGVNDGVTYKYLSWPTKTKQKCRRSSSAPYAYRRVAVRIRVRFAFAHLIF